MSEPVTHSGRVVLCERSLTARLAEPDLPALRPLERTYRRGVWRDIDADNAVDALHGQIEPLVVARPASADRGAALLWTIAAARAVEIVRLPAEPLRAAWVVAIAARIWPLERAEKQRLRALQLLSGGVARAEWAATDFPQVDPHVLLRWAANAWKPCRYCSGGGLRARCCGRCGLTMTGGDT